MLRRVIMLMLAGALLFPGLVQAEDKKKAEPKKVEAKPVAPKTEKAATPKGEKAPAPPAPSAFEPVGPNFVSNPSFEDWKAGAPLTWNIATGAAETWEAVKAKQDADAQNGKVSISIPAPKLKETVVVAQTLGTGNLKFKHETRVLLAASVKTPAKNTLHIVLSYNRGGQEHKIRRIAEGTGKWEKLRQEFWIPKDADLESFRLSITRLPGAEGKVLVDDVKVQLMAPAKPAAKATPAPNPAAPGPKMLPHGVKVK